MRRMPLIMLALFIAGGGEIAAADWRIVDLGSLPTSDPGYARYATDVGSSELVVGGLDPTGRSFLADATSLTDVFGANDTRMSFALGVNRLGDVVGRVASTAQGGWTGVPTGVGGSGGGTYSPVGNRPFVWTGGQAQLLSLNAYFDGRPFGAAEEINDRGDIVGWRVSTPFGSAYDAGRAFMMRAGESIDIGVLPGGSFSLASAVNEHGQVVGTSGYIDGAVHAFLWNDGALIDLAPALGTASGRTSASSANDINDHGDVVGTRNVPDSGSTTAFLLRANGQLVDLGTLPGAFGSYGFGVNNPGHAVGYVLTPDGTRAFLHDGQRIIDLSRLPEVVAAGWSYLEQALAIADDGTVVGIGFIDGRQSAFLLTPVPEPRIPAMLMAGLITVFVFARPPSRGG